jgi:adenosyl cobinamide kinase/adenosyl cobinamide phosphate guanylyltransferase
MEENILLIDCLIICVKNKLFIKPHERMHQPNINREMDATNNFVVPSIPIPSQLAVLPITRRAGIGISFTVQHKSPKRSIYLFF